MDENSLINLSRTRSSQALRKLVKETILTCQNLVLPIFVAENIITKKPIQALPGIYQHHLNDLTEIIEDCIKLGISGVMLFGIPTNKDKYGSESYNPEGILNKAINLAKKIANNKIVIQSDLCLDEFTTDGHCGLVNDSGIIQVPETLQIYAKMALAQAQAGSEVLGLSGMVDSQVAYIRKILDKAGHHNVTLLAYSAKYASAFYGPFREAVNSSLTGNRKAYQMDPANLKEGLAEVLADIQEGADYVMVKPALPYLDVLKEASKASIKPVWAYQVSGEYAMIKAAGINGWIDEDNAFLESLISIKRAGANTIITYWALEAAKILQKTI